MSAHRLAPTPGWETRAGNDDVDLAPVFGAGDGFVEFDFPGVSLGTAEYAEGPTGVTVLALDRPARTSVDARGGAIGILGRYEEFNRAIVFAGGSSYGLAATTGVNEELLRETGNRTSWQDLISASGAVIYDYAARETAIAPDAALGIAAYRARRPDRVAVGRVGAGISATSGKASLTRCEFTGQGVAFRALGDIRVLVVTVPNPLGVIVDRDGTIVRGNYDAATGERTHLVDGYAAALAGAGVRPATVGNTTLTAVVTNVAMSDKDLRLFGRQVHSSMHRGIQPFHTNQDGDTLFALTTADLELPLDYASPWGENTVNATGLATVASEVAWDALLRAAR
jgi:L-aminopeptidase/D-esterase-like protein